MIENTVNSSFFNVTDYIYIAIMLLSTLLGVVNGFSSTVLNLFAWIGSGFLSTLLSPYLYKLIEKNFEEQIIAQLIASSCSYLLCLIILFIISHYVSDAIKKSILSSLDRAMGLLLGLIRGLIIPVGVVAILLALQIPKEKFESINESKISGLLFEVMRDYVPKIDIFHSKDEKKKGKESLNKTKNKAIHNKVQKKKKNEDKTEKKASQKIVTEASNFKISRPEHHSLGSKIVKKL